MRQAVKRASSVIRHSDILDGRPGFRLQAEWGYVSVLDGGGHICELVSYKHGALNPLWKPTWKTIDPSTYTRRKHTRVYGPPPEGRLLAGIAGHSISFDYFGPPSPEEIAAGHSTHGEAPVVNWHRQPRSGRSTPALIYDANLPRAQMRLRRVISLDRVQPVAYCEETAFNLATFDRPISWNHHVTFGPPFLESGVTLFDMPATRSKVCSATFSKQMSIEPDAEFQWPNAPTKKGASLNLRTTERAGSVTTPRTCWMRPFRPLSLPSAIHVYDSWFCIFSIDMSFPGSATGKNPIAALMLRGMGANSVGGLSSVPLRFPSLDGRPLHKESCSTKPLTYGCRQRASLEGDT